MRAIHAALSAAWAGFELSRIIKWAEIAATVFATTVAVLLASFVAVTMGLT